MDHIQPYSIHSSYQNYIFPKTTIVQLQLTIVPYSWTIPDRKPTSTPSQLHPLPALQGQFQDATTTHWTRPYRSKASRKKKQWERSNQKQRYLQIGTITTRFKRTFPFFPLMKWTFNSQPKLRIPLILRQVSHSRRTFHQQPKDKEHLLPRGNSTPTLKCQPFPGIQKETRLQHPLTKVKSMSILMFPTNHSKFPIPLQI